MSNIYDTQLLHHVHNQTQVVAIYIYRESNDEANKWRKEYPKVVLYIILYLSKSIH